MIEFPASWVSVATAFVWVFAALLAAFSILIIVKPNAAWVFLSGFAANRRVNNIEVLLRSFLGAIFIVGAEGLSHPKIAFWAGVFLIVSAGFMGLFFEVHHRYAQLVVPPLRRLLPRCAAGILGLSALLVWSLTKGVTLS